MDSSPVDLSTGVEPYLVTGRDGNGAANASFYPDANDTSTPPRELRRRAKTQAAAPYHADTATAIAAALTKSGIRGGRIGYDSLEAQQILVVPNSHCSTAKGRRLTQCWRQA